MKKIVRIVLPATFGGVMLAMAPHALQAPWLFYIMGGGGIALAVGKINPQDIDRLNQGCMRLWARARSATH